MTMVKGDPVKTAQPGAIMYRRSDVRGKVMKIKQFNVQARRLALSEDRHEDAELHLAKIRSLTAILYELDDVPMFENPIAVEVMPAMIRKAMEG